ncbi:MAG: carboxypeptidase-like regulatory domain-containing protein, partial [Myxococcota bacterium]
MRRAATAVLLVALAPVGCEHHAGGAYARRITTANELIGGPAALGTIGDWAIGNGKIRVIIQDKGWSRGFGIFGGGIIDADLQRAGSFGSSAGGTGKDNFGEFFPALFLMAFDVQDLTTIDPETGKTMKLPAIEVINDGSDGEAAIIRARALGGDFLTMVSLLLDVAIPSDMLNFETDFIVEPGVRHVRIVGRIKNVSGQEAKIPLEGIMSFLSTYGVTEFQIPLGDVALFGAGNAVFAPGAVHREGKSPKPIGFDLRFSVDASYAIDRNLPALPGLVTDLLATAGPEVSYGLAVADSDTNYVWQNRAEYLKDPLAEVSRHSMLVPFLISSFTGAYYEVPPAVMEPFSVFEYERYLIIGNGDIASVRDELYKIRNTGTGRLRGRVVNAKTGEPETKAWIHILDENGHPFSQIQTDANGRFTCRLGAGNYRYRVTAPGRYPYPSDDLLEEARFEITATCEEPADLQWKPGDSVGPGGCQKIRHGDATLNVQLPPPSEIVVRVRDAAGNALPAKVTLVSRYEAEHHGKLPMKFLFDLSLGEHRRHTDLSWRNPA